MQPADKPLNHMDRLADMGHFPVPVHAGATLNVLLTIAATRWVEPRFPYIGPVQAWPPSTWPPVVQVSTWIALVLALNLTPVWLLRRSLTGQTPYPTLRSMNFFHDQHKFSDWVYLAASANMAFWILLAWSVFAVSLSTGTFWATEGLAALATFSPVLLRRLRHGE